MLIGLTMHREIIFQLDYNSGHIANPFSLLFYPHRSEHPAPFHLMCPRINNQNILDPLGYIKRLRCLGDSECEKKRETEERVRKKVCKIDK